MSKKLTQEEFIKRATDIHGCKYSYEKSIYVNSNTKLKIVCNKCKNIFEQLPDSHIRQKQGCSRCSRNIKLDLENFILKSIRTHGDKYNYSKIKHINGVDNKVDIICNTCKTTFSQSPAKHINKKHGCPKCNGGVKSNTEEFIKKAIQKHGHLYSYNETVYFNNKKKVKIICKKHGIFKQSPNSHLNGGGCQICGNNQKLTTETFIERATKKHGDKYNYNETVYHGNNKKKVKITCKKHGIFTPDAGSFLRGCGCDKCRRIVVMEKYYLTKEEFIERSMKVHGDFYDYGFFVYNGRNKKVNIICKKHNKIFEQTPGSHMRGSGCPICKESIGERKIRIFLTNKNIKYTYQKKFNNCVNYKTNCKLSFDFYLLNYNLLIEFDGPQHSIEWFWGDEKQIKHNLKEQQHRDDIKNQFAKDNNINLLRIKYTEFKNIEKILECYLKKNTPSLPNETNSQEAIAA